MSNYLKRLRSSSLFFKVASIVLISVILVCIFTTIITIKISKDVLFDTFSKSNYKVLTQIAGNFIRLNDNIINIMNVIDTSPDFQRYLTEEEMSPQLSYSTIYNMTTNLKNTIPTKDFYDITVIAVGFNGYTYVENEDRILMNTDDILHSDLTKNALANKDIVSYQYLQSGFTKFTKYSSTIVATKVLSDKFTRKPFGLIYVFISNNTLKKYYRY